MQLKKHQEFNALSFNSFHTNAFNSIEQKIYTSIRSKEDIGGSNSIEFL